MESFEETARSVDAKLEEVTEENEGPIPVGMQMIDGIKVWGRHDQATIEQMKRCALTGPVVDVCLMADGHLGYSQAIGGVVAYDGAISPSGVGYDVGCGNLCARTNIKLSDIEGDLPKLADEIFKTVAFGMGRMNANPIDHPLFEDSLWKRLPQIGKMKQRAQQQLGTVGSGNHYVDVFVEPTTGAIWIGCHFGSRGFGHGIASGFLNLASNREWDARAPGESMDQPPTILKTTEPLGQDYIEAMNLALQYAYAGRDYVVGLVLQILGASSIFEVHNNHNDAKLEEHDGQKLWVVRKGATPLAPGQFGFVGGNMCDISVIVQGKDTEENKLTVRSTVHGAGRIHSRTWARGKRKKDPNDKKKSIYIGGNITEEQMMDVVKSVGVELRGGGPDESPFVYRKLSEVIDAHSRTLEVQHILKPVIVCMAPPGSYDPYKD